LIKRDAFAEIASGSRRSPKRRAGDFQTVTVDAVDEFVELASRKIHVQLGQSRVR
jgi:hypothetical protein